MGSTKTRAARDTIFAEYPLALTSYLSGEGEAALRQAYEIGRAALKDAGVGLLDLALVHHQSLEQLIPEGMEPGLRQQKLKAAGVFLAESLSAFEMAYRSFRETNAALRHINEVLEQETRRVADMLHNEVGQSLFAAELSLADLQARLDPAFHPAVQGVANVLNQASEQLRSLSHDMRPTILDDLGWLPAIEFLAQGMSKRSGIEIKVSSSFPGRLPASLEAALFRVCQEALTNVTRHSRASHADVRVEASGPKIICTVFDDGVGFDLGHRRDAPGGGGLGLLGIRERLDSIGGTLEVQSQPGQGTRLIMTIPYEV